MRGEEGLAERVRDSLRVGVHLGEKQGRYGRLARTHLPIGRGWPRLAEAGGRPELDG